MTPDPTSAATPPARRLAVTPLVLLALLVGCGEAGPERFELSGKVLYNGRPAPGGQIVFTPQEGGPGSVAMIRDGAYRTFEGKGVLGGAYRVTINTLTAPTDGTVAEDQIAQFRPPYQTEIELPRKTSTLDFELPADER